MSLLDTLLALPRRQKRIIQVLADSALISLCFLLAMFLRLDSWEFVYSVDTWLVLFPTIPVTIYVFVRMGLYRAVLRYIGSQATKTVVLGILASAIIIFACSQIFGWFVPRSVPAIYALLATIVIGGIRLIWRGLYAHVNGSVHSVVAIYGAGTTGRQVAASLRNGQNYVPILFLDDDPNLKDSVVAGLKVFPSEAMEDLVLNQGVEIVLLAMPELNKSNRQKLLARLETLPVQVQTVPDMGDLVSGKAKLLDFQSVKVEDLLGRDPIPPKPDLLAVNITGKSVLVSGAGGSIGSELCRQIANLNPSKLVMFEQSEFNLYQIKQELTELARLKSLKLELYSVLGSVQNRVQTQRILSDFDIETVYHAAAYKHVPLLEENVVEGICNNVVGTRVLAEAAIAAEVGAFIFVSTDKAVRPTNVMGASKRMAELVCQGLNHHQNTTRFSMVRFGNVLGSSGSVIPLFHHQIAEGGPVTVTARDITRYFMTIPEAAQLVIQAGAMAKGGDVFLLEMGEPVKILDLARKMIRLSGFTPWIKGEDAPADIEITFIGLRPGEKLYEELLISENSSTTAHPRIMTAHETRVEWAQLEPILLELERAAASQDTDAIRKSLEDAPTGYRPTEHGKVVSLSNQISA